MTQRAKILVVDDTPSNVKLVADLLKMEGYALITANSGPEALEKVDKEEPDLVLLDVMMPGMNGFETCGRLKENEKTKDIPVIFMTALSDTGSEVKAFSMGAVDYVTKPIRRDDVLARVTTHLKIRSLQMQLEGTIENLQREAVERERAEQALREAMHLTQKANDRMRKDLEAAARVQQALLPESLPLIDRADFAWVYRPCAELGGDSLNLFQLDARHVGVYVLDVSGHGVPASLMSVTLSRVLTPRHDPSCLLTRAHSQDGSNTLVSPAEVASRLNRMFPVGGEARQYFTLIYGILDTEHRQFRFVCAGHPAPIHFQQGQRPNVCEARNLPIGLFEDEQYEESIIHLEPGDRIYLYSDGVLEAMNGRREIFDEPRLISAIEAGRGKTLNESVDSLVQAVLTWSRADQVHDDLSILAVECK